MFRGELFVSGRVTYHFLGGGFKYLLFSPRKVGKSSILTHIFQMGWFNHHLDFECGKKTSNFLLHAARTAERI